MTTMIDAGIPQPEMKDMAYCPVCGGIALWMVGYKEFECCSTSGKGLCRWSSSLEDMQWIDKAYMKDSEREGWWQQAQDKTIAWKKATLEKYPDYPEYYYWKGKERLEKFL